MYKNIKNILAALILFSGIIFPQSLQNEIMIVGHRGAAGKAPENTIASINLAEKLGANVIEIDLRQTKDGVPVAIHDSDVDRTTDSSGEVSDYTFKEIQKLDAGSWFDEEYAGEKIPSLEEVIQSLNDTTVLIIEFKGGLGEYKNIEKNTLEIVNKLGVSGRVILKSFDPEQLKYLRELTDGIPLLYVYAVRIPWLGLIIDTGVTCGSVYDFQTEYLQPHRFFLSESFVKEAQAKSFKIIAWGVHELDEIKEAVEMGVDGIETDYPGRVRNYLDSLNM